MAAETGIESSVKQVVPLFMVANILESIRFYVDGLGFEVTNQWIDDGKQRCHDQECGLGNRRNVR